MKRLILLLLLGLLTGAQAQEINGLILGENQEAIAFATVTLKRTKDTSLVKATISNEAGRFNFRNIPSDTYMLRIRNLGYEDYLKTLNYEGKNLELGTINLVSGAEKLDEVTVVADKPMVQVLPDKTVFNVENTINATGTSAFELLRKAPGVIVDNNGGFIVEGKSGVQFFINGKLSILQGEDLTDYLESLQATDIESVEIITQPSSKYDAAGNAGIINIVLKKDKSLGTNGSVVAGVTVGDFARTNSSISFNNRRKK